MNKTTGSMLKQMLLFIIFMYWENMAKKRGCNATSLTNFYFIILNINFL
jgi:hypothetical protein